VKLKQGEDEQLRKKKLTSLIEIMRKLVTLATLIPTLASKSSESLSFVVVTPNISIRAETIVAWGFCNFNANGPGRGRKNRGGLTRQRSRFRSSALRVASAMSA